ncbi:MAG: hypothetical protein D6806_13340 [Deltaproteobacteria bacterium]|nr:MAG: hypothetical protein D6806_13340 [Deltaproteobacteria bacterium]
MLGFGMEDGQNGKDGAGELEQRLRLMLESGDFAQARQLLDGLGRDGPERLKNLLLPDPLAVTVFFACLVVLMIVGATTVFH